MEIVKKPGDKKTCCENTPQYVRGKPGPSGDAATIEIVGVYTIEPTDPARVENVGDKNAAKLELFIPKGDHGNVGPAGKNGADGKDYVLTEADKKEIAGMIDVNVDGVVGGYYTPEVSQVDENTMRVSFSASGDKMPPVQSAEITLPAGKAGKDGKDGQDGYTPQKGVDYFDGKDGKDGKDGSDYILTEADKQDIAGMVNVQGGGGGFIVSPEPPEDTSLLWIDPDDDSGDNVYTKAEIDAMFGSYITDINTLVGGDA